MLHETAKGDDVLVQIPDDRVKNCCVHLGHSIEMNLRSSCLVAERRRLEAPGSGNVGVRSCLNIKVDFGRLLGVDRNPAVERLYRLDDFAARVIGKTLGLKAGLVVAKIAIPLRILNWNA